MEHASSTVTLGALKARKALETRETTKLLHLHLLLGLLLKTEHGRKAILPRLLLHALKSGHAIHLHALKASQLLPKAAHGTGLSLVQHRELLLLDLLLKQGLLMPLGLGNESQLVLLLLRVEAISATTCLGLGLGLLEESGESVESNRWLVFSRTCCGIQNNASILWLENDILREMIVVVCFSYARRRAGR